MSSKSKFKGKKPDRNVMNKRMLQTIQELQQKIQVARATIQILVGHLDFVVYESRLPDGPYTIEDTILANDDCNRS